MTKKKLAGSAFATKKQPAKRNYRTVNSAPLAAFVEASEKSLNQIGEEIGVTGSAVSGWISSGQMPKYMHHVLKALDGSATYTLIVDGRTDQLEAVAAVARAVKARVTELS